VRQAGGLARDFTGYTGVLVAGDTRISGCQLRAACISDSAGALTYRKELSLRHADWLRDTGIRLNTVDKKEVAVWEFAPGKDKAELSAWAAHFRQHYCPDHLIDRRRKGTKLSRADYLRELKFPDINSKLGPAIRAGDFAEVLVADYLQFRLNYSVPRTRYANKTVRDESTKGSDILAYRIVAPGTPSASDELSLYEVKAQFSGKKAEARLQEAIDGSAKDKALRLAETLNAVKSRLQDEGQDAVADEVERFQNPEDHPYNGTFGAAALFHLLAYDGAKISESDCSQHPESGKLRLLVIRGQAMMELVNFLYETAANEA
jgi:hypothetical protein